MKKRRPATWIVEDAIRIAKRDTVRPRPCESPREPLPPLPPEESELDLVRRRYAETGRFLPGTPKRLAAAVLREVKCPPVA